MHNRNTPNPSEEVYGTRSALSGKKTFALWRELIPAYLAPAIMAGIGGLVTADQVLQFRSLTTIGGTSLLVALFIGLWLKSRGSRKRWIAAAPRVVVVGAFALAGALFGLFAAWGTTTLLDLLNPNHHWIWVDLIKLDFPLSGAIACTTMSWRWRASIH